MCPSSAIARLCGERRQACAGVEKRTKVGERIDASALLKCKRHYAYYDRLADVFLRP